MTCLPKGLQISGLPNRWAAGQSCRTVTKHSLTLVLHCTQAKDLCQKLHAVLLQSLNLIKTSSCRSSHVGAGFCIRTHSSVAPFAQFFSIVFLSSLHHNCISILNVSVNNQNMWQIKPPSQVAIHLPAQRDPTAWALHVHPNRASAHAVPGDMTLMAPNVSQPKFRSI